MKVEKKNPRPTQVLHWLLYQCAWNFVTSNKEGITALQSRFITKTKGWKANIACSRSLFSETNYALSSQAQPLTRKIEGF